MKFLRSNTGDKHSQTYKELEKLNSELSIILALAELALKHIGSEIIKLDLDTAGLEVSSYLSFKSLRLSVFLFIELCRNNTKSLLPGLDSFINPKSNLSAIPVKLSFIS